MDLTQLANLGEFIGGVAVIGSLIFVGLQVRANTKTQRAASGTDTMRSWAEFNQRMAENQEVVALLPRIFDPNESLANLNESEIVYVGLLSRGLLQRFEAEYYQYQAGLLHPELWAQHRSWCHGFLQLPVPAAWWESELQQPLYTAAFIRDVGAPTDIAPVNIASLPAR